MANALVIAPLPDATGSGSVFIHPEELSLLRSGSLLRWHNAAFGNIVDGDWSDAVTGTAAEIVADTRLTGGVVACSRISSGGPDDAPYVLGPLAQQDGRMIAPVGSFPIDQNWSVAIVAKRGTNDVAATPFGIVGNNGRAVAIEMTSTAVIVRTRSTGTTSAVRISAAYSADEWHYILLTYNETTKLISLFIDGVLVGTATYTLIYLTDRYSLMGTHDLTVNLASTVFRDGSLASAMVISGDAAIDSSLKSQIDLAIFSRFPSLA